MKESDYIKASNLTRLKIAEGLVRDAHSLSVNSGELESCKIIIIKLEKMIDKLYADIHDLEIA